MEKKRIIDVKLDEDIVKMQVIDMGGEQDVSFIAPDFDKVMHSMAQIAKKLNKIVNTAQLSETEIEFGLSLAMKSGKISSIIVEGNGEATLKVKMKWKKG